MTFIPIDFATNFKDNYYPNNTPEDRRNYLLETISKLRDELGKNPRSDNYFTYSNPILRVKHAVEFLVNNDFALKNFELQEYFKGVAEYFGVVV